MPNRCFWYLFRENQGVGCAFDPSVAFFPARGDFVAPCRVEIRYVADVHCQARYTGASSKSGQLLIPFRWYDVKHWSDGDQQYPNDDDPGHLKAVRFRLK